MQCRSQDAVGLSKTASHATCAHLALRTVGCSLGSAALALVVFTPFPINKPAWKCARLQLLSQIAQEGAKILSMDVGRQCRHSSPSSQGCVSLSVSLGPAQHDMSTGCSWSGDTACAARCYTSASWALSWPKARLSTPTLPPSLTESNKGPCQALDNFLEKECC